MTEYYVTLFSNNSTEYFNNTLTSFTNKISPEIHLEDYQKWRCGILDIQHNFILDHVFEYGDDEIIFGTRMNNKMINVTELIYLIARQAKNPGLYNSSYFHVFTDVDNLDNFPDKEVFNKFDTTTENTENKFQVSIVLNVKPNQPYAKSFFLNTAKAYTANQIFYKIITEVNSILINAERDKAYTSTAKSLLLKTFGESLIDKLKYYTKSLHKSEKLHPRGAFFYIYTDIIEPRHVGSGYYKVLNVLPINEVKAEYTSIKNVLYFPVDKEFINDISIRLCDEFSQPIPIEAGFNPTCVTLHFKKYD